MSDYKSVGFEPVDEKMECHYKYDWDGPRPEHDLELNPVASTPEIPATVQYSTPHDLDGMLNPARQMYGTSDARH